MTNLSLLMTLLSRKRLEGVEFGRECPLVTVSCLYSVSGVWFHNNQASYRLLAVQ